MSKPDGRPAQWVRRKHHDDGAWSVFCALCGKKFDRYFSVGKSMSTPQAEASSYVAEHLESKAHAAAVAAYRLPAEDRRSKEERLLWSLHGKQAPTDEEQMRRAAARSAAEKHWVRKRR